MDKASLLEVENRELFQLASIVAPNASGVSHKVIVVVPVDDESAASELAVKLAATIAATSDTSLSLIDCDFASPSIARHFAKTSSLEAALSGPQSFQQMLQASSAAGTILALAPVTQRDAAKKLALLKQLKQLLQSQIGDIFILLAPPARDLLFFSEMAGAVDGAIIVVEANVTRRKQAKTTVKELTSLGLPVLGAVLTGRTYPIPDYIYDRL